MSILEGGSAAAVPGAQDAKGPGARMALALLGV